MYENPFDDYGHPRTLDRGSRSPESVTPRDDDRETRGGRQVFLDQSDSGGARRDGYPHPPKRVAEDDGDARGNPWWDEPKRDGDAGAPAGRPGGPERPDQPEEGGNPYAILSKLRERESSAGRSVGSGSARSRSPVRNRAFMSDDTRNQVIAFMQQVCTTSTLEHGEIQQRLLDLVRSSSELHHVLSALFGSRQYDSRKKIIDQIFSIIENLDRGHQLVQRNSLRRGSSSFE